MSSFNEITTLGRQFVKIYYHTFYSDLKALYKLYNPEAIRTKSSLHKDEHSESWVGIKEIKESFEKKGSGYKNVKIIAADFQPSFAGSILVTVSGTLMEDEDTALDSISFVQVFVLVPAGQSWAIQNDVLRFDAFHYQEKESESNAENSRNLIVEEVKETQEANNENVAENEENSPAEKDVTLIENENKAEESNSEVPKQSSNESSENKEENTQTNATTNQAEEKSETEEPQTDKKEENTQITKNEEETQKVQQTATQNESEPQNSQNKKSKFNKKFSGDSKNSPKSKNWRDSKQNSQNNKLNAPPATPAAPSAPSTPSYADIAKKIAAAGSLNPLSSSPSPAPPSSSPSADSSEKPTAVPSSEPVTQKEQAKTQQQGKREYKDSPNPFRKDPPAPGLNKTIVARNLPASASKENLKTIFEEFGNVSNVHIVSNSPLAFIEFSDPSSAQAVLLRAKTSPILVEGKEIRVEPKKKRTGGPPGGGKGGNSGGNVNNNNNNNNRKKEYRVRGNNNDSSSRGNN